MAGIIHAIRLPGNDGNSYSASFCKGYTAGDSVRRYHVHLQGSPSGHYKIISAACFVKQNNTLDHYIVSSPVFPNVHYYGGELATGLTTHQDGICVPASVPSSTSSGSGLDLNKVTSKGYTFHYERGGSNVEFSVHAPSGGNLDNLESITLTIQKQ
jgi:hypothetical protein